MESILFSFFLVVAVTAVRGQKLYLLVGAYTNTGTMGGNAKMDSSGSKGIYLYRFDVAGTGPRHLTFPYLLT